MKKLSICIACYNEEENILDAYNQISSICQDLKDYDYEIIFADNASKDDSEQIFRQLAEADKHVKVIFNYRNYGPARSSKNVCIRATGDAVISLPCDLQDPPEMIPVLVKEWEAGNLIVWGQKTGSQENPIKYFLRNIYYRIIKGVASVPQLEQVTGFGIIDRSVWREIKATNERTMSVRHLVADLGYPVKLVPYTQRKRKKGKSSYNLWRWLDFAINSLINTSTVPLRMTTLFGLICSLVSFFIGIVYLVYKLIYWNSFSAGIAPIIIAVLFLGSVQIMIMGVIGEYIGVVLSKVTKRPLVLERECLNFEEINEKQDDEN